MSAILEETGGAVKVVLPQQPETVELDTTGDGDIIVAPHESETQAEEVVPCETVETVVPVQTVRTSAKFHVGSLPNVVFVLSENHDLAKLNTFYVLIKDRVAVMVRNQSDATLEDLQGYLLQKYETGLVTPTFSADNVEKSLGKYEIV